MILSRLARLWRRVPATTPGDLPASPPGGPRPTLDDAVTAAGGVAADWCRQRRHRRGLYSTIDAASVEVLKQHDPVRTSATIAAAERLLRHEFDLLGSGVFVPADPDRPATDGYQFIDWYLDPVRWLRFPRGVPHTQWNLLEMRPSNADVKYPWELARCQHWVTLAQAYRLAGDDRFALEISRQLDDFVEANPVGIGVNWTCTMDVGLRVVSWATALELVASSPALGDAFWLRAYPALFDHAVFISHNLENKYEVTSNHFLSNLVGLQFAATVFDDLPQGLEWNGFARAAIERELEVQVLPDGADYESSIPYHRLVAELFLGAAHLAAHQRAPLASACQDRVRDMVAFLAAVTRPDGLMPQVGDADDGRLHIFEGYAARSPQDPGHLFGPAGMMFDRPDWVALGGDTAVWEASWWGFQPPTIRAAAAPPSSAHFPHAGVAVARSSRGDYLIVTNGVVGTNGFGNHKHNDLLSFEYHHTGHAWIVDPGSYVYTSDPDARNRFRSTRWHNTLIVDGIEQNDMRADWLFRMFERANPESLSFVDADDAVEYVGCHHGYERLAESLTHTRAFRFSKRSGEIAIVDRVDGRGRHDLQWHFHLAPGVHPELCSPGVINLTSGTGRRRLHAPRDLDVAVVPSEYSPSYGVRVSCLAIRAATSIDIDGQHEWMFEVTA